MKKHLILLPFLLTAFGATAQNNCPVNAKRYMHKMHLKESEVYYVSKTDYARRYAAADRTLDFPNSPVYNAEGKLMLIEAGQGKHFPVFTCFQSFTTDLDSFIHEAKFYRHVTDTADNAWVKQHVKQVYNTPEQKNAAYNFVVYYPAGYPFVRKRYQAFVDRVRYYQQQGQDISLFFVLVPVRKKE